MSKPKTMMIDDVKYVREDSVAVMPDLSNRVLVRTRNAGVHVGTQVVRAEGVLVLENANRIYCWRGAHDLSYVAMHGVNRKEYTKISCMVPKITLTCSDVAEVIPIAEGVDLTECGIDNG